jgi:hypothetical protein
MQLRAISVELKDDNIIDVLIISLPKDYEATRDITFYTDWHTKIGHIHIRRDHVPKALHFVTNQQKPISLCIDPYS